ncbi:MAG: hypothetical protein GQ574_10805 [Crocinitomix sp.]|nr:hypothetical protein [Crocinitomix sp.]
MRYVAILISAFLLFSCGESPEKSPLVEDLINEVLEDTIITEVDTVAVEQKILSEFAEEYSYFDDSLNKKINGIHYDAIVDCKLNFNGDEWLDYFVTDGYGGGVSGGYFYDGKTGDLIEGKTNEDFISSGAGRTIVAEIIDVNCTDNQKELVVITGGGGNVAAYYFCNIYRYDIDSNAFKNIFCETISAVNWDDADESKYVNYIDVFYNDSACVNEIIVQKGVEYETKDFDPTAIKPFRESQQYHYVYDDYEDQFLLDRVNCLGKKIDNETVVQLAKLNDWYDLDADPFELIDLIGKGLVQQLNKGLLNINEDTENINFTASKDGRVNVVTITYPSMGTAGTINLPILQWEKSDGTYGAKALYPDDADSSFSGLEVDFYAINQLPYYGRDLYILTGNQRASGMVYLAYALVIEIKDDEVILDLPAFFNSSPILSFYDDLEGSESYCIACMDYDAKNYTITIEGVDSLDNIFIMENSGDNKEKEIHEKGNVVFEFKHGGFELQK